MAILITGASSGIGESLAREAARRKHDIVLVARRKDKLEEIADELSKRFNIHAEIVVADLTDQNDIKKVEKRITKNDIDVLINNAGFGSAGPFAELNIENELNEIDLNVRALVQLSYSGVKSMLERDIGTIVNISSLASYMPMTGNAVYGATKAFVTSFSHALREELGETGINVMVVCPGMTSTEFFERSKWKDATKKSPYPNFMWQTSQQVAELIFSGIDKQRTVVVPGLANKFAAAIASSLPGSVTRKITALVAKGRRLR